MTVNQSYPNQRTSVKKRWYFFLKPPPRHSLPAASEQCRDGRSAVPASHEVTVSVKNEPSLGNFCLRIFSSLVRRMRTAFRQRTNLEREIGIEPSRGECNQMPRNKTFDKTTKTFDKTTTSRCACRRTLRGCQCESAEARRCDCVHSTHLAM